ncbi:dihydrolipoamide acetyltransferase family protein [Propionibacteriaceae bacterium Y1685]|uniref:dihydrolipoamide acetyltransferase family protein n=1 Tax=Microlunatus sp. Y1700 TaxID=3418487 RepID=UPI003B812F09
MKEFRLPDPGEGLVEAEIITWNVAVGDRVEVNDIVVEVETSKSLVELPIPFAGTVSQLLATEGETVDVGTPIIVIDDGSGAAASAEPAEQDADEVIEPGKIGGEAPGGRIANLVGYGSKTVEAKRRPRRGDQRGGDGPGPETQQQVGAMFDQLPPSRPTDVQESLPTTASQSAGGPLPTPGPAPAQPGLASGAVLAKPPVRKLAKDLGVDLSQVVGSGDGGIITRADVESFSQGSGQSGAEAVVASAPTGPRRSSGLADRREPIKGVRRMTAQAMVDSAFTAPHVTEWITVDVTATMDLLDSLRARREFRDLKLSPTLIIARAALLALRNTPELNAAWDGEAGEVSYFGSVNLGIAAATPRGLVVPNITDADSLSLVELAQALNDLVSVAKQGRTQPADMSGGTFTITNVGVFGVDAGTPILNPGESGILCLGAINRRPWVVGTGADERIEPRWVTTLALSFDHRLVDGEGGSRFLADLAGILTDPGLALLY